ncbi:hypothetical protein BABINDRAFT_160963 [Babjeviella inositovora NRRL Y-12698]|uniref:Aminotransferase class I/classII large domain-containing protein n=1 Tax=Babjeviella inositovora NRRL Y-12698 TaxID=984486 RepID=A0A1E3QSR1_9ASCO|nr:uncharacterized protein BABINDRAFT_160963 [Babjeviella inositovora NRRL Y-12698]ODQ80745.1 hypothetical protein BABINDRAFT_160963 [Babjeviella inositovora NRRL Y-12698]
MTRSQEFELSHHISRRAANRQIRPFMKLYPMPADMVPHPKPLSLGGGLPNHGFFPIDSLDIKLVSQPVFNLQGNQSQKTAATEKFSINRFDEAGVGALDLRSALQYEFPGDGHMELRAFTRNLISRVHKPAFENWDCILTNGSGNGLDKIADLLVNEGDVILVEEFTFPLTLQNIVERGGIPFPVKLDLSSSETSNGLDLGYLTDLLQNWEAQQPSLRRPKAIYTIPTGQNPTGLAQSLEFRREVYDLCTKHDLIIIEDDPYGYLTLPSYERDQTHRREASPRIDVAEVDNYLQAGIIPSYLTLDTAGRVVRCDSFSKLYSPGLRLGFIVAHAEFITKLSKFSEISTRGYSGLSQAVLLNSIKHWGTRFSGTLSQTDCDVYGWLSWVMKVRNVYIHRRDVMLDALYGSEAFSRSLIQPLEPKAGMFVSVKVNFTEANGPRGHHESVAKLMVEFVRYGILVVSGSDLCVDDEISKDNANFFRLTLASSNCDEEIVESINRFTHSISQYFK